MTRTLIALAFVCCCFPAAALAEEFRDSIPVQPGGTLEIELAAGSVEVETGAEATVRFEAKTSGWGAGSVKFDLSGNGVDARLVGEAKGWFGSVTIIPQIQVRVRVPEQYSVKIRTGGGSIEIDELEGSVTAWTSGGSIELDGAHGPVELITSGGSISAEDIEGDLAAETSGGKIQISEVSGRVEVRTSGGSIRVHDVGSSVRAQTSGGSISVRFSHAPEGKLKTSGGSIEAEFGEAAHVSLEARTSGGRVEIDEDFALTGEIGPSRVRGQINGGGPDLHLETSGGNIRVRMR